MPQQERPLGLGLKLAEADEEEYDAGGRVGGMGRVPRETDTLLMPCSPSGIDLSQ